MVPPETQRRYHVRRMKTGCLAVCVMALVATGPLSAHHSGAAYSGTLLTVKTATITNLVWANPHTIITFEAEEGDAAGAWNIEAGSPSALTRMGWNRNSLRRGDVVTIELYPARNGAKVGRLLRLTFADGRELRDSQTSREAPAP